MRRIRVRRKAVGLTQDELALKLNVSRTTVTMWETTDAYPSPQLFPMLAQILGCTIDDLFDQCEEESHTRGCVKPGA